jgi:phage terminase large subunit GpA-like protein
MMLIEPTLEMAGSISKDRIAPMLRDTPALRRLLGATRSRDASNTVLHKSFAGGTLVLAGGNSAASLASRPMRVLLVDEADRLPATAASEGDPLMIAFRRTATFARRKIIIVSSPTVKDASRIESWYQISDQRHFRTPCPRCATSFVLEWPHVRWENHDPQTAHLECPHCPGTSCPAKRNCLNLTFRSVVRSGTRSGGKAGGDADVRVTDRPCL